MQVRTMARAATVGLVAAPLALAASGMASASEGSREGHCVGPVASQQGGLADLDAAVDPTLNVGSILGGSTSQQVFEADRSQSGILQSGACGGSAFQTADLVGVALDVSPTINLGGLLGGATQQSVSSLDSSNSGIVQS